MKKTYLTPEYCRKAIKSWLTDVQPQDIGELVRFARCTVEEADPLLYRQWLLELWHDASDYMRQVILIATRPTPKVRTQP